MLASVSRLILQAYGSSQIMMENVWLAGSYTLYIQQKSHLVVCSKAGWDSAAVACKHLCLQGAPQSKTKHKFFAAALKFL